MTTSVAEHLDQQIRAPVDDGGHAVEAGRGVDHAEHLDDSFDAVERAELGLHRRENRQSGHPCRIPTLFECEVAADLAAHDDVTGDRAVPADVQQATVDHAPDVAAGGREHGWQFHSQFSQPCLDHDLTAHLLSTTGDGTAVARQMRSDAARPAPASTLHAMPVTIDLSAETQARLETEAARRGLTLGQLIADLASELLPETRDDERRHRLSFVGFGASGGGEPIDIRRERAELAAKKHAEGL